MQNTAALTIPSLILCVVVCTLISQFRYTRKCVTQWAAKHRYKLLKVQRRYIRRGPFTWSSSKYHDVFYVIIQSKNGKERTCFLRVGTWRLFCDNVQVEWT